MDTPLNATWKLFPNRAWVLAGVFMCLSLRELSLASSGTEGAAFLDIPVGAAPAALGSAYSALAEDAYAPVWNPAGLGKLESTQVAGQHLSYLESIHYEYLSAVHPLYKGKALGASIQYLGTGDITRTDVDTSGNFVNPGGSFSSHYASYNLAYGQTVTDKLSLGLTAKWINASIDETSANAFAADLGSLYQIRENLTLAAVLTNVGTKLKFIDQGDSLPLAFKAGAAYHPHSHWLLTGEVVYPKTGLASWHIGMEWRPIAIVSLRAGYKTDTTKELGAMAGLATGIGIDVWGHEFAYAWSPYGDLGSTHYFSLVMRFGEAERRKRNLIYYNPLRKNLVKGKETPPTDGDYQQLIQLLDQDNNKARTAQAQSSPADPTEVAR